MSKQTIDSVMTETLVEAMRDLIEECESHPDSPDPNTLATAKHLLREWDDRQSESEDKCNAKVPERTARLLKLYKRIVELKQRIVTQRPHGSFGIAVENDALAIKYQQRVCWRKEIIEAYFEGREPNKYSKSWYRPAESEDK